MVNLNFDSTKCHAEQMWNVTAEAGKKTLVWHWPGSAWPPSSDSENLHVVDGTSPGGRRIIPPESNTTNSFAPSGTSATHFSSLNYLMENNGYEVVFSHFHAPDLQKHMFIRDLAKGTENTTAEQYEFIMQEIYRQTDRYLGKFVHFLDEGWTLMVVPIHAYRGLL